MRTLPRFDPLWQSYPGEGSTADDVKRLIGGAVNASWIRNTCAIRLSRALNYAGQPIPHGRLLKNGRFLSVVSGADKLHYSYRLSEIKQYIFEEYGPAQISETAEPSNVPKEAFLGQKGIIVFDVKDFADATGHIDIWNGERARLHSYFTTAYRVCLWRTD